MIGDTVGVDKSTVSRIVRRVSLALANLLPQFCQWPTDEQKKKSTLVFSRLQGFLVLLVVLTEHTSVYR